MKKESGRHHAKYIPMLSPEVARGTVLLPGRHTCVCEASEHSLINNCLHCGRIVCEQEGSGPCYTCGNLVCMPKEQEIISRQSKSSFKLYQKLMGEDTSGRSSEIIKMQNLNDSAFQNALEHRNQLLEFDKTVERRAKVIDDENDYFEVDSNKWLTSNEKKILNKKKEELYDALHVRQKPTLSFDFAGRVILEEKPTIKIDEEELLKPDTSIFACENSSNINIPMSDEGMSLSLHQPYASLLAAGIKLHEGRIWYTSYRGRLWIHAAGKTATTQEIKEAEHAYYFNIGECAFPENYPPGCLLGCVDLVDCLPQEEYREQFPKGESASPYVLICENAQELMIKFPMKGKHKLFKLDSKIHQAAKKTIRKLI